MRGITEVYYVNGGLGKTPAATNRKTGVLYLNLPYWKNLPYEHKLFVLLHELGHIVHDTSNEFLADSYAFEQYAKLGYSLTESVYALSKVLTLTTDEHFERIEEALHRALKYDALNNKNLKADKALRDLIMYSEIDGFNLKKFAKKALTKTPLKFTPAGLLVPENRKSLGKTVNRVATKTPLRYTPMGMAAGRATAPKKRVSPTPSRVVTPTVEPLLAASKPQPSNPIPTPTPTTNQEHWSDENEPIDENTDFEENEELDENEAINSDVTDGFNLKSVFKKIGDKVNDVSSGLIAGVTAGLVSKQDIKDLQNKGLGPAGLMNLVASSGGKKTPAKPVTKEAVITPPINGGGVEATLLSSNTSNDAADKDKQLYIIIAIVVIVVIVLLVLMLRGKK